MKSRESADKNQSRNRLASGIAVLGCIVIFAILVATVFMISQTYTSEVAEIREKSFMLSIGAIILVAILLGAIAFGILRQSRANAINASKLDAARQLTKTKEAIFSSLSHDMRTPLNAIIGFSELASKEQTSPAVQKYLENIRISGNVLLNLLNDTIVISRINEGERTLDNRVFSSSELAQECAVVARADAEKRDLAFVVNPPKQDGFFYGDRNAIQKIFLNIASNAIKYTPAGGTITVSLSIDLQDEAVVPPYNVAPGLDDLTVGPAIATFTVSDTGIGMSPEFIEHMFEPFTQENPASAMKQGVGLGLSIVKHLADLIGASIDVESAKGSGSSFTVTVPLWQLKPEALGKRVDGSAKPVEDCVDCAHLQGSHLLVCEDNALNRELVKSLLSQRGIQVTCVNNGEEGCEAFARSLPGEFDAILMDLRMPKMDGLAAAKTIRAMGRADAKTIPIVALSADAFDEDKIKSIEAGMHVHLSKPIVPDVFIRTLAAVIKPRA